MIGVIGDFIFTEQHVNCRYVTENLSISYSHHRSSFIAQWAIRRIDTPSKASAPRIHALHLFLCLSTSRTIRTSQTKFATIRSNMSRTRALISRNTAQHPILIQEDGQASSNGDIKYPVAPKRGVDTFTLQSSAKKQKVQGGFAQVYPPHPMTRG